MVLVEVSGDVDHSCHHNLPIASDNGLDEPGMNYCFLCDYDDGKFFPFVPWVMSVFVLLQHLDQAFVQ